LKIFVVGHCDNTGSVDHNLKLSQDRAQSVMQALIRDHGIASARLRACGCGLYAPVASNDAEDGRAKNRRVELVKQLRPRRSRLPAAAVVIGLPLGDARAGRGWTASTAGTVHATG
jgi:hypothetical protein